jgi:hypothetical protein
MAETVDGVITIVQEGRFQLTDDGGVSHLFVLGRDAAAEPAQLQILKRRHPRVRVEFEEAANIIGNTATKLFSVEP